MSLNESQLRTVKDCKDAFTLRTSTRVMHINVHHLPSPRIAATARRRLVQVDVILCAMVFSVIIYLIKKSDNELYKAVAQ